MLCRAQRRGDRRADHANARNNATQCEFAFRPTQPTVALGAAGRAGTPGEGRGASPSPCASVGPVVRVLAAQYADIGPSTHRMDARVGPFPLKSDFSQCAADAAALSGKSFFSVCVCVGGLGCLARASPVTQQHSSAAPHPSRCNSLHGIDRALSATHGMAGEDAACGPMHVACCMFARCMLHAATWCACSRSKAVSARTHARARATCKRRRIPRCGIGR